MNISPITYNHSIAYRAGENKPQNQNQNKNAGLLKYSPAGIGVFNGVCWFGIGMAFDKVCQKILKTNSSTKTSLIVNSLVGLAMCTYSYYQAKKMEKNSHIA